MVSPTSMLARTVAVFLAFCLGWVVYMIAMMMTVYDGALSLILQPIMAVFVSGAIFAVANWPLGIGKPASERAA